MRYVLDYDALVQEHILRTGAVPSIEVLRMFDWIIEIAYTAYQQGSAGKAFNVGRGIPVKQIE